MWVAGPWTCAAACRLREWGSLLAAAQLAEGLLRAVALLCLLALFHPGSVGLEGEPMVGIQYAESKARRCLRSREILRVHETVHWIVKTSLS